MEAELKQPRSNESGAFCFLRSGIHHQQGVAVQYIEAATNERY